MDAFNDLYTQIRACQRCDLHQTATHAVPGTGPLNADIMFIGEAPGFYEDRQGVPFVGAAGKLLDELMASIGIQREDVYITNVVKHRPPSNRDPLPIEIEACKPWLDAQMALIKPKIVITLGRFLMARFFPKATISRIHGEPRRIEGIVYIPMLHPAAALHQPQWRSVLEADFLKVPKILEELSKQVPPPPAPRKPPEQLTLL